LDAWYDFVLRGATALKSEQVKGGHEHLAGTR